VRHVSGQKTEPDGTTASISARKQFRVCFFSHYERTGKAGCFGIGWAPWRVCYNLQIIAKMRKVFQDVPTKYFKTEAQAIHSGLAVIHVTFRFPLSRLKCWDLFAHRNAGIGHQSRNGAGLVEIDLADRFVAEIRKERFKKSFVHLELAMAPRRSFS